MTPQRRNARNKNLPKGLRERDGYFSWTDPTTGKEYGLGRDAAKAKAEATEALLMREGLATTTRLVDRINGSSDRTWSAWLDVYGAQLKKRKRAANTQKSADSLLRRARATFPANDAIDRVTTLMIAEAFDALQAEGKARTAQAFRSFLKDCFRAAVAAGWITHNPVLVTEAIEVEVNRARLTLGVFRQVRALAPTWLQNAMDLALVSGQRREEISAAKFADFKEESWFVEQRKTGKRLILPLALRLDAAGLRLGDVLKQCRTTGVLSKFLVHQTQPYGNSPAGSRIWIDTITRRFSEFVGELQIDWQGKDAPTFHEIRSLAARLYQEQGNIDVQELLGHSDPRMTNVYRDSRGAEWTKVKFG